MEIFMINKYDVEFKKKIVRLFREEGRTKKSISNEFSVSVATISNWVRQFRDECQINEKPNNEYNYMEENLRLRKELEEVKKENEFLKKQQHSSRRKSINGLSFHSKKQSPFWCQMVTKKA